MLQSNRFDPGATNPPFLNWLGSSTVLEKQQPRLWTFERSTKPHHHIFLEGASKTHLYVVLSGVVGAYKVLVDGRRQFVAFSTAGDIVGLDQPERYSSSAEALTAVRLRCISVADIDRLATLEPRFALSLLHLMSLELSRSRDMLLSLGRQSAIEKVATFLLHIAEAKDRTGEMNDIVYIPIKRVEIADYLGLTVETVSRQFTIMRNMGIIKPTSHSRIIIMDRTALATLSNRTC